MSSDETDPYGAIQAQLIQRTGESTQQEIQEAVNRRRARDRKPSELLRTMNRRAASHNVRRSLCWNFSSAATDRSANYLGIHHANNRRESRRSRRQNPRSEHSHRFTFDKTPSLHPAKSYPQEIERLHKRIDDLTMKERRTPERRNSSRPRNRSRNRSFSRSRNLVVGITKSFKNELRNAFHPAAIKKKKRIQRGVNATTFSQPHISRRFFH
ncbi:hypothetical protein TNCV_3720691 [Trichonephila clavipes]|nr:hypothetical protein TNCV_3720691 [Trichonephila clavipes]